MGGERAVLTPARPCLIGAVDHEANVYPTLTPEYLKLLAQRRLDSEQSKRPLVYLDSSSGEISQAKLNQLASGFTNASSTLGKRMVAGTGKGTGERNARMDKGELTDRLFALFSDKPYWTMTGLKAHLQQPDTWLREVLSDVAVQNREGRYANMWQLKEDWKEEAKDEAKDEEEDDDDSDLEEVQLIE